MRRERLQCFSQPASVTTYRRRQTSNVEDIKTVQNELENLHMILLCKKGAHGACARGKQRCIPLPNCPEHALGSPRTDEALGSGIPWTDHVDLRLFFCAVAQMQAVNCKPFVQFQTHMLQVCMQHRSQCRLTSITHVTLILSGSL